MLSRTWTSAVRRSATHCQRGSTSSRSLSSTGPRFQAEPGTPPSPAEKAKGKEENTVLPGVNYLKGQAPVLAKKDSEYPDWLWTILKPKVHPEDGPGGKAEKVRLRQANRRRIKEQNFLKTQ